MKTLCGLSLLLVFTGGLFAQRTGGAPYTTGGAGNVVFPAGTPATNPFITRAPANVIYPGGGGPHLVIPGTTPRPQRNNSSGYGYSYAYPVYVPSYDPSMVPSATPATGQTQPQVIVIYPPGMGAPMQPPAETAHPSMQVYSNPDALQTATPATAQETQESEAQHYLLAFKDHSIYSVVAYWVDGDTLHYFTAGNGHHQSGLTQLDREMTQRLNKETGVPLNLPPAK